jgi:hypothetical protein
MMQGSRGRSAVLACPSLSDAKVTTKSSPRYQEWPELEDGLVFCTLPTIGAHFHPNLSIINKPAFKRALDEMYIEPYKTQLLPLVLPYCQSHFGIEIKKPLEELLSSISYESAIIFQAIGELVYKMEGFNENEFARKLTKLLGLNNAFSVFHENGHRLSLALNRPATEIIRYTTAEIFNLLIEQAATNKHDGFWPEFNKLNTRLKNCLSIALVLEELRATIFALEVIPLESKQKIIDDVYPEKEKDLEYKVFSELRSLTGERGLFACFITLLVEILDPLNPLGEMEKLRSELNAKKARRWSEDRWWSWVESRPELEDLMDFIVEDDQKFFKSIMPRAFIISLSSGTNILYPNTMRGELFLESIRQQLANLDLIRSVNCPFIRGRNSCCGFGHCLQGIWAGIPDKDRRKVRPPSKVCLE